MTNLCEAPRTPVSSRELVIVMVMITMTAALVPVLGLAISYWCDFE